MSERLVLLGIGLAAVSGVPGLFLSRSAVMGQRVAALLVAAAALIGLAGLGVFWSVGPQEPLVLPWTMVGAEVSLAVDGLTAVFLAPTFMISLLGSIYGLGYWKQTDHPQNGCKLRLFYGLLTAGMALLVVARTSVLFLCGWEIMALSAYFLVATEDDRPDALEAGWLYLVATHFSTLCLMALFALMHAASGSWALTQLQAGSLTPALMQWVFVLALLGFGLKAGVMPLHIWLPNAHAMAPSHVSAIMSGVLIKMGVYGLLRVTSLLPNPPTAWGVILLVLGGTSGVLGMAFALGQRDLKRLLAYSSIENVGIIIMGLGLALMGRAQGRNDLIILGLGGCLLHVWNHSLFKSLLFLGAGSIIHAVHTREMDRMGGLAKQMPQTAICVLVGVAAICGLPPLNGFVSEFLIYTGLFRTLTNGVGPSLAGAAFAVPVLALIGALAAACFVRLYGIVFLGSARSETARMGHEAPRVMLVPMTALAILCGLLGLAPVLFVPLIGAGVSAWAPGVGNATGQLHELVPLGWLSTMGGVLITGMLLGGLVLWVQLRIHGSTSGATWGCGYAAPTSRMQYTSSSFTRMLVNLFGWALRPKTIRPRGLPLFPPPSEFRSDVGDTVLDEAVLPAFAWGAGAFSRLRVFQQGSVQAYLLYIFIALIALLLWR